MGTPSVALLNERGHVRDTHQYARISNLDYLRGCAAFSVMIYHYVTWGLGNVSPSTLLGKLGIYAVSIFYILSGLTLYLVYGRRMQPTSGWYKMFLARRFYRIYPLMWLVMVMTILLSAQLPEITKMALNFTGMFGFVAWDSYIGTGMWSIGNELTFYAFFCVLVFLLRRSHWYLYVLLFISLVLYVYFAFFMLNSLRPLGQQWAVYINPLNQLFLFSSGIALGYHFKNVRIHSIICVLLIVISVAVFLSVNVSGDAISLVVRFNRIILTISCLIFCLCVYKLRIKPPPVIHYVFSSLGESSYSLYLLHPIVWSVFGFILGQVWFLNEYVSASEKIIICAVLSLVVSYSVYRFFEMFFIKKGKLITEQI